MFVNSLRAPATRMSPIRKCPSWPGRLHAASNRVYREGRGKGDFSLSGPVLLLFASSESHVYRGRPTSGEASRGKRKILRALLRYYLYLSCHAGHIIVVRVESDFFIYPRSPPRPLAAVRVPGSGCLALPYPVAIGDLRTT